MRNFKDLDWVSIGYVFILNIVGLLSLFSALHMKGEFIGRSIFLKQIFWILLGWFLLFLFSNLNHRLFYELCWFIYGVSLFLLIFVAVTGKVRMGAQRWLQVFGFSFQPSELAKIASLFVIARNFSSQTFKKEASRSFMREIIFNFFPVGVLCVFIFIQPDLGTSLVLVLLFILTGLASGLRRRNILIFSLLLLLSLPFGWSFLKDYQKERLTVFLNPDRDPLGAGYTIIQSRMAIGSGRFWGKGFLSGTQNQLNFIPARHTDFIFTVVAEEWGFIGCIFLLSLYYLFLRRILYVSRGVKEKFSFILCVGIFSLFFIHIFINITMVMGLLPVVGLPLLFLSYGGSYMIENFILVGIFLNISKTSRPGLL